MNTSYKTAISFQDLCISVKMINVSKDSSIELVQRCKESKERIKYRKYCLSCNKEITNDNVVKGYKYNTTDYIVLSDENIDSITTDEDKLLLVQYFCKPREISDLLIDKCYYLIPEIESEKNYSLFRKAMISNRVVAISEIVLDTKQKLVALFPNKNCIVATVLYYENEINELPIMFKHRTKKEDLDNLKLLVSDYTKEFDWFSHYDKFQERLKELITDKMEE